MPARGSPIVPSIPFSLQEIETTLGIRGWNSCAAPSGSEDIYSLHSKGFLVSIKTWFEVTLTLLKIIGLYQVEMADTIIRQKSRRRFSYKELMSRALAVVKIESGF